MKKAAQTPRPWEADPNYFTRLMKLHNWPPGFVSQLDSDPGEVKRREAAVRGRATQLANGHTGSIRNGLSRKSVAVKPSVEKARIALGRGVDIDAVHVKKAVKA